MENQSIAREEDRKARLQVLDAMKVMASFGHFEEAKELGICSKKIADRIATKDYSHEDKLHEQLRAIKKL